MPSKYCSFCRKIAEVKAITFDKDEPIKNNEKNRVDTTLANFGIRSNFFARKLMCLECNNIWISYEMSVMNYDALTKKILEQSKIINELKSSTNDALQNEVEQLKGQLKEKETLLQNFEELQKAITVISSFSKGGSTKPISEMIQSSKLEVTAKPKT